jgi:hypothetical protein
MKSNMGKIAITFISIILLLTIFLPGCGSRASSHVLQPKLSFAELPILNKPVQLTAVLSLLQGYNHDAHDVSAQIILPDGFEKIEGDLEWHGDIKYGTTKTLTATVKSVKTGNWEILCKAYFDPSPDQHLGDTVSLYVIVSQSGATVSDRRPHEPTSPVYEHTLGTSTPPTKPTNSTTPGPNEKIIQE